MSQTIEKGEGKEGGLGEERREEGRKGKKGRREDKRGE